MLIDDIRHAWRRVVSRPATVLAAAAMLALGIGLTTTMFTVADSLLVRPVPFEGAERMAHVMMMSERGGRYAVSKAIYRAWRESPAFERVESAIEAAMLVETDAGPVTRTGAIVTPGLFDMLGVRPIRGRLFQADEGRAGAADRVLVSEDLWRAQLGADDSILGARIVIDDQPVTVVGILPADFRFPDWDTVIWRPIDFDAPPADRAATLPIAMVRFAGDVPPDDAIRVATEAARAVDPAVAEMNARARAIGGFQYTDYYERAIPLLLGGVGLVFLILCANVASLLLVRLGSRRREFGLCSALGASRVRLLRQALIENAMLGLVGAVAGVALAAWLVATVRAVLPESLLLQSLNPVNLDARALAAACVLGVLATVVAGVLPAWIGTRLSPSDSLRFAERAGSESKASRAATRGLIVAEIALACTLLVGATVLVRSFVNIVTADRGLRTDSVLTAWITLPSSAFPDPAGRETIRRSVEDELRGLPGVRQMALSFGLPPDGGYIHFGDAWRADTPGAPAIELEVNSYDVGPGFFDLYGIPLLRGRTFQSGDTRTDVIVGERMAALLWPDADPVGRSFSDGDQQLRVIGLAGELTFPSLDASVDRPEFYKPLGSLDGQFMASLRCDGGCPSPDAIRQRLLRLHAAVNVVDIGPLDAKYAEQFAQPRAAAALGSLFSGIAVIAAAGGLFSVLSFAVGRRRREFGIRTALGSTPAQLRRLVLGEGLKVAGTGVAVGAGFAWLLARSLGALQYGVEPGDTVTWLSVAAILAATTLLASWRPARRAARIDPVRLLREE